MQHLSNIFVFVNVILSLSLPLSSLFSGLLLRSIFVWMQYTCHIMNNSGSWICRSLELLASYFMFAHAPMVLIGLERYRLLTDTTISILFPWRDSDTITGYGVVSSELGVY